MQLRLQLITKTYDYSTVQNYKCTLLLKRYNEI